ncbi:hypothetical protein [Altererythrobacter aquiaggeris]|uniref:hypothetical protein n=1 Tax=Aestuarierythrobacter aquiaggeris TaxID=1898396 RepID=UPI003018F893
MAATTLLVSLSVPTTNLSAQSASSVKTVRILPLCANGCLNAVEAVTFADYLGDKAGVAADFDIIVKEVGEKDGLFFLNTEEDYRDRNNLTISLRPETASKFLKFAAGRPNLTSVREHFLGKRMIIRGTAKRVRIDFIANGERTGKYYYQVHVRLIDARQLLFITAG